MGSWDPHFKHDGARIPPVEQFKSTEVTVAFFYAEAKVDGGLETERKDFKSTAARD